MKAEKLNQEYLSQTLNLEALKDDFLFDELITKRPHLFSQTSVFLDDGHFQLMKKIIEAIEHVVTLDEYKKNILQSAPTVAKNFWGPHGVLMGFDFHLGADGPKLIEINTNAGGSYLSYIQSSFQKKTDFEFFHKIDHFESKILQMFLNEWEAQGKDRPLKTVAILDDRASEQFLYPEFLLFKSLFERNHIKTVVASPEELKFLDGHIQHSELGKIDLIYNRLTDFYLEDENHQLIKEAYRLGQVVLTPSPYHHALYANKTNLTLLSDPDRLNSWGLGEEDKKILLKGIPKTIRIVDEMRDDFWAQRKKYFFKPISGYGSKGVYRGDKMTRGVWEEIKNESYVAQELVIPSERHVMLENSVTKLKTDIRAYSYCGEILLLSARLYSGQTTNFRTTGGGFAPVLRATGD